MIMRLILPIAAILLASSATAEPRFVLVTPDEAAASEAAGARGVETKSFTSSPLAPRIDVVQPAMQKPVANPFDVVVRFTPQADATLDPKSLRVRYGFLRIDVTDRMLGGATWAGNQISANGAEAPKGKHKFYVQIADSKKRSAETPITVVVQ